MADSNTPLLNLLLMDVGSHDNDWGTQTNTTLSAIEAAMKNERNTVTTGGTTTLTKTTAREWRQRITGALASNAIIEVPNIESCWYFSNETTGNFTLTVKVTGQTGVTIPSGSGMWLRGNGTDVVAMNMPQPRGAEFKARTVGGTVDAITVVTSPAPVKIGTGMIFIWTSAGPCTVVNPTFAPDSLGPFTIKKGANAALDIGDTGPAGYQCMGIYDGAANAILLLNPYLILDAATKSGNNTLTGNNTIAGGLSFAAGSYITGGSLFVPGGRLTLQSGIPVPYADTPYISTMYYTPYQHNRIALYNGTGWSVEAISELSQTFADTTKSPAAVDNAKCYDLFVWNDGGTIRLSRGPAWTTQVDRGTGIGTSEIEKFQGIDVNKYNITNGPLARRGTWVGSFATDATPAPDTAMIMRPAAASGGAFAFQGVWNRYNRCKFDLASKDNKDTWNYTTGVFRATDNSQNNRIYFMRGAENCETVEAMAIGSAGNNNNIRLMVGLGLDSSSHHSEAIVGCGCPVDVNEPVSMIAHYRGNPGLGHHYFQALEFGGGSGATTWRGDNGFEQMQGLYASVWA